MLIDFFLHLKNSKLPVSTREFLTLLDALEHGVVSGDIDDFYFLARTCLVKDESLYDREYSEVATMSTIKIRNQGVSDGRIAGEYIEHRRLEIPVPLDEQFRWLEDVGFTDIECFWKYLNLAMFGGRKRPGGASAQR